jgi:membrane associated rhomboid family serine protease
MIPLKDTNTEGTRPFWVLIIIAINIYFFYLEMTSPNLEAFVSQYALIPANVNLAIPSTLFPFISSQFLHGGFLHIISNMLFLWIFGDNVENALGFLVFPIFYLVCGVAGGLAQYLLSPDSVIPMLGASGAIAGVLGAYFAYFPNHKVKTLVPIFGFFTLIDLPASLMLIYWIATQVFSGITSFGLSPADSGGVAFFAHIGGFITGFLLAKILRPNNMTVNVNS